MIFFGVRLMPLKLVLKRYGEDFIVYGRTVSLQSFKLHLTSKFDKNISVLFACNPTDEQLRHVDIYIFSN